VLRKYLILEKTYSAAEPKQLLKRAHENFTRRYTQKLMQKEKEIETDNIDELIPAPTTQVRIALSNRGSTNSAPVPFLNNNAHKNNQVGSLQVYVDEQFTLPSSSVHPTTNITSVKALGIAASVTSEPNPKKVISISDGTYSAITPLQNINWNMPSEKDNYKENMPIASTWDKVTIPQKKIVRNTKSSGFTVYVDEAFAEKEKPEAKTTTKKKGLSNRGV